MLTGHVNANMEPLIELMVNGPSQRRSLSVVIDTGFNGYLAMPSEIIQELELAFLSHTAVELADGTVVALRKFLGEVQMDERRVPVTVLESNGGSLLGMALLQGCELMIQAWQDGRVQLAARK